MAYQPIENYGIIGDMHTAALVGLNGSIDWLCFPHFDSPSVFAAILDDHKGGYFEIGPADVQSTPKQFYWPETNVLVTRFLSTGGVGQQRPQRQACYQQKSQILAHERQSPESS